jgi:adenine-specific DNA-methyltransferase
MKLSKHEIKHIIEILQDGHVLPEDYKYKLFPVKQKEYELVYGGKMRREDILANEDGVFPVPLQIEKIFNGKREQSKDGWKNIVAFGDNLQFLKTIYENKDPLIKDKVKGKVKLIYIDPPFATEGEFKNKSGAQAYTDKAKGADFVEFLRRRLIIAKEILAEDGFIAVHLDYKKGHYVKIILDEVFGENNFRNEVYAKRKTKNLQNQFEKVRQLNISSDTIFIYSKSFDTRFVVPQKEKLKDIEGQDQWNNFFNNANRPTLRYPLLGISLKSGQWRWNKKRALVAVNNYKEYSKDFSDKFSLFEYWNETGNKKEFIKREPKSTRCYYWIPPKEEMNADTNWSDIYAYDNSPGSYPTQKSEQLLERIISTFTTENDIVLDFFAGGGTTSIVAEKLNRKWITIDIGKLSFYVVQKRLLNIMSTIDLKFENKKYNKAAKSFVTINTGHYDLKKIFDLQNHDYSNFVMNLFEVEPKKKTISGIQIDGEKKDGFNVIIWQYWKFKDSTVDEDYLHNLHSHIGSKSGQRVYIIAPASYVDFISDYYPIDKIRYYFLKVPYHIIRELHKVQFKKFRQPQSKSNVNDLEDAIGFHFMRQPEVKSEWKEKVGEYHITIKKFYSDFSEEETDRQMDNFESLAMVLIDKNFDGETFDLDAYYFAEDLLSKKKKKEEDKLEENIKEELRHINRILLPPIPKKECGAKMMLIYVDIYGNEFKEEFKLK